MASLSNNTIFKSPDFEGQTIIISGASDNTENIIVLVEGPIVAHKVWKKEKIFGIWVNNQSATIPFSSSYYYLAATQDIPTMTDIDTMRILNIDLNYENIAAIMGKKQIEAAEFYKQFKLLKQISQQYSSKVALIERIGPNIFRTKLLLPEKLNEGRYNVMIYKFDKGFLSNQVKLSFEVQKTGIYGYIDTFAKEKPFYYAMAAILIALVFGAIAGFLFRKDK